MSLVYSVEDFQSYLLDAVPLWKTHHEEVALSSVKNIRPFAPDIKKYLSLEDQKLLGVFTIRDENNNLKGYAIFVINTAMHYRKNIYALNDALYLSPDIRKGREGIKFMKWCESQIIKLTNNLVSIIQWRTKVEHNFGRVLESMGYSQDDICYTKFVGVRDD